MRERWTTAFDTPPTAVATRYKIVVEIAGKHLEALSGHLELQRTPDKLDFARTLRFSEDAGNDKHRVQLCFDDVPQQTRKLWYIIGTCRLPLSMNTAPVAQHVQAAQWPTVLVPVIPMCRRPAQQYISEFGALPPGWLYVYLNGYLWREVQIYNETGVLCDVNLALHAGKHLRPSTGQLTRLLLLPHKLNGVTQSVQIAHSRQQWSWTQLCQAGGINPDDPRFLDPIKQRAANIAVDAAFQNTHLNSIELENYRQSFKADSNDTLYDANGSLYDANGYLNGIHQHDAQPVFISHVSSAPELIYEDPPLAPRDLLTNFRHLNIAVINLPVSATEPLVIAYLNANNQLGIQAHYRITCHGGMQRQGALNAQGQVTLYDLPEGPVTLVLGDPSPLEQLQQRRDQQRQQLRNALSAMVTEVEARAYNQNQQLLRERLIRTDLIYTGAFLTGLYHGGTTLNKDISELVTSASGFLLKIQLANTQAMHALMQGDVQKAQQIYALLVDKGASAAQASEDVFDILRWVMSDAKTREFLINFPKQYLGAHTSVEQTRMAGNLSLDILLILAGATAEGTLVAINHSKHLDEVIKTIRELATTLKAIKLKQTVQGHTNQRRIEVLVDEKSVAK